MNETLSRSLLALEAIGLLLPLSLLYGVLFILLFFDGTFNEFSGNPAFAIATLLAGAGLIALWRLLATGVISGIAALREVHRGWMRFCALIAAWVAVAWLIMMLAQLFGDTAVSWSRFEGVVLGIYGAPALIPLLHLAAERYLRNGDRT